jgi:hypothetical protein
MKETPRRRIMVTSSIDKYPRISWLLQDSRLLDSGQILKDDGTVFLHLVYLPKGFVSRDE